MRTLGYCCGRKYVFHPQVLCCYGKQLCTVPRDAVYWSYENRYVYCQKCFDEIQGDQVTIEEDPGQPGQTAPRGATSQLLAPPASAPLRLLEGGSDLISLWSGSTAAEVARSG